MYHFAAVGISQNTSRSKQLCGITQRRTRSNTAQLGQGVILQLNALRESTNGQDGDHLLHAVVGRSDDEWSIEEIYRNTVWTGVICSSRSDDNGDDDEGDDDDGDDDKDDKDDTK